MIYFQNGNIFDLKGTGQSSPTDPSKVTYIVNLTDNKGNVFRVTGDATEKPTTNINFDFQGSGNAQLVSSPNTPNPSELMFTFTVLSL